MVRRKLIKQGDNALTLTVPAKWTSLNSLKAGDEVEVIEEDNQIILQKVGTKHKIKQISITLKTDSFQASRSIIGGLYRGGYDEIMVKFDDYSALKTLQKVIENLYGLEIVDISKNSCLIKSLYQEEITKLSSHIKKMIYNIKTIKEVLMDDFNKNSFNSGEEILQLRNNVLKQRDLIARVINKQRLLDNQNFPFYLIAFNLWQIAKNYRYMYNYFSTALIKKEGVSKKASNVAFKRTTTFSNIKTLEKVNTYFDNTFSVLTGENLSQTLEQFYDLKKEIEKALSPKESSEKNNSADLIYTYAIALNIEACKSSLLILEKK